MASELGACTRRTRDGLVISCRITPRASRDLVAGIKDGALQVRTTAPPADGKANKAVIRLLAVFLGVPRSRISLLRGARHRDKQFLVTGDVNGL